MKIKTIISSICLMLLAISCSMDDDDMLNDVGGIIAQESGTDMYAGFSFDLTSGAGLSTKTITDEGKDSDYSESQANELKVEKCFVVVANGDEILGNRMYTEHEISGDNSEYTLSTHITVKVPANKPPLTVFVIGYYKDSFDSKCWNKNMTENVSLSSFTSLSALENSVLGKKEVGGTSGNSLSDYIKTGKETITGYYASDKMADFHNKEHCSAVHIPLTLRAAAIELMSFTLFGANTTAEQRKEPNTYASVALSTTRKDGKSTTTNKGNPIKAEEIRAFVTDVEIDEQVINTVLSPDQDELINKVTEPTSFLKAYESKEDKESSHPLNHRFYSYENTKEETKVTIKYQVNNVPGECTFVIGEKDRIQAGHLYQLHVTIINTTATLKLVTSDWKYNKVEQSMEEVLN